MVPPAELKKKHQAGQTDVVRWWVGRTSNCKRPRWVGSKGTAEGAVAAQTHPGAHFSSQPLFPVDLHRTPPPPIFTPSSHVPSPTATPEGKKLDSRLRFSSWPLRVLWWGGGIHKSFAFSLIPPPNCSPEQMAVLFNEELGEGTGVPGLLPQPTVLPLQWEDVPASVIYHGKSAEDTAWVHCGTTK